MVKRMLKKRLGQLCLAGLTLPLGLFFLLYLSPRPPLTIDPETLRGDGSTINYCNAPVLHGRGLTAAEIPKGNTPNCSYAHFPLPILRACTEPLAPGVVDIRGLWRGIAGKVGHVERIEQCGARTVITAAGLIHDSGPNATAGESTNDTEGSVLFTLGKRPFCPRTSASMVWNNDVLNFRLLGWGPVVVRRYLDGEHLLWEYADGSTTRLERLCTLPEADRIPRPRGARITLF